MGGTVLACNNVALGGERAYADLKPTLQRKLENLQAIHSARRPYSPQGFQRGGGLARSMKIKPDEDAWSTQFHPMVRTHPETGAKILWINPVYTIGIRGMIDHTANTLLAELFTHMTQPEYIYKHQWRVDMLAMWDNRSVMHCAQGGYDGFRRVMHRTTVAGCQPC